MNIIEQLEALPRWWALIDGKSKLVLDAYAVGAIIEQEKREAVEPVAIDSGYIEGTAERLRLICSKLGIGAPESNEELMLCQFSLFGLIRGKIDAIYKTQPDHTKLIGELVGVLERAQNGFKWFVNEHPDDVDEDDIKLQLDIDALLTKAREAIK